MPRGEGMSDDAYDQYLSETFPQFLDMHSSLPTQTGISHKSYRLVSPTFPLDNTSNIEFNIQSGSEEQIHPGDIRMLIGLKIVKADGSPLNRFTSAGATYTEHVGDVLPVNGLATAMFKNIEVTLNDKQIASFDGNYAYKADIQNRLFTTVEAKKGALILAGFDSEAIAFDDLTPEMSKELFVLKDDALTKHISEVKSRKAVFGKRLRNSSMSKTMHYVSKIHSEIFNQPKLLPSGMTMRVAFSRSPPDFCLLSKGTGSFMIQIEYCKLRVPIAHVDPTFLKDIEYMTFKHKAPMCIPLRRVEIKTVGKSGAIQDLTVESIISGEIVPRRIFVCFVKQDSYVGRLKLDPFNYQGYDIETIALKLGGQLTRLPAINVDFENKNFVEAVYALLDTIDCEAGMGDVGINTENFHRRNAIYAFDVTGMAGKEFADAYLREERIPTGLHIRTSTPLPDPVQILIYKEFDAEIKIDQDRVVEFLKDA